MTNFHFQTSLMETGREQMERSFRNLLTRSSSPVSANTLLDILNAGEGKKRFSPSCFEGEPVA